MGGSKLEGHWVVNFFFQGGKHWNLVIRSEERAERKKRRKYRLEVGSGWKES